MAEMAVFGILASARHVAHSCSPEHLITGTISISGLAPAREPYRYQIPLIGAQMLVIFPRCVTFSHGRFSLWLAFVVINHTTENVHLSIILAYTVALFP